MKINILLTILMLVPTIVGAGELDHNWGLYAIKAKEAQKLAKDGETVRVCVIDTGIDANHQDLKHRLCDQGSDEYGWDFIRNRKNPVDVHGHGTHVAGIIAAVAPSACIIPVKWMAEDVTSDELLTATIRSVRYCIAKKAQIINFSGGGAFSVPERRAIQDAGKQKILYVAAAGNNSINLDQYPQYFPASYDLPNMMKVASMSPLGHILPSSNYGPYRVQVAAPGEKIFSTFPFSSYNYMTGTSMSVPFVAGIAALILSKYPQLTPIELKRIIMSSVNKNKELKGIVGSGGEVNAEKAMLKAKEYTLHKKQGKVK